jgi:hypothetical protein
MEDNAPVIICFRRDNDLCIGFKNVAIVEVEGALMPIVAMTPETAATLAGVLFEYAEHKIKTS